MDNITVRLNYDLKNSDPAIWIMNHEAFKSNMDKLKLILFLCETKLEKDIDLPFDHVTIIGTDYINDAKLRHSLWRIIPLSRKIGVNFRTWEIDEQKISDFA